jgi:hypothetical protein
VGILLKGLVASAIRLGFGSSTAIFLLSAPLLCGQTCQPGELRVFVKDSQQAAIFDAQVRIGLGASDIALRITETGGIADFPNVPCGSWTVRVSKSGFEDRESAVQVASGGNIELNIVLEPKILRTTTEVTEVAPPVAQASSQTTELHPSELKALPTNPATVTDTLPLVPSVVRSPQGELKINGSGEQRSTLVVNQSDVTDPATGKFGQTVPVDAIEEVNVLNTPFLAQYGRFTQSVVAVETRRGGEKWHADLTDPFPDFRIRSYHMRGIRNETPRNALSGPLIRDRLYFITALTYSLDKVASRTLGFPHNESKQESVNSFTQLDYILSPRQVLTAAVHISPQHTSFVNPDYFHPQPVTPSYAQRNYIGRLADHYGIFGGTLDSSISFQRFGAAVGAQGDSGTVLTPEGNTGNFFGRQTRDAGRREWLEIWSPAPIARYGTHQLKVGTSLTWSSDQGQFNYRAVEIRDSRGRLLEQIDFANGSPFNRYDLEFTGYGQDHWSLNSKIALDYGLRLEHQRLASSFRIAPRAGVAWTPFSGERTVFRAGYGEFYDHIPLDVYTFSRYPLRTITTYAPDGSILGSPVQYINVIGSITGPRTFLVNGKRVAGSFTPRGATWNFQIEHSFSRLLRVRALYTDNRSVGLITVESNLLEDVQEVVLNGNGSSHYRQAELTSKLAWSDGQQLVFSYARSRARGSLNIFDMYLGNFPIPIIQPETYSNLPGDLPNRFLLWGRVNTHFWSVSILPIVEYRNGFPYAVYDAPQNYVGVPYGDATRFPIFFSADTRLSKDFKVSSKYGLRLSVTGFNLTNHFNALAVHDNTADPQYGVFFGNWHRRYRFDFEVLF